MYENTSEAQEPATWHNEKVQEYTTKALLQAMRGNIIHNAPNPK